MIKLSDIAKASMTEEKKKTAKHDWFAYYIGRPLSYVFTWPFLYMKKITPNMITVISMLFVIAGFALTSIQGSPWFLIGGWIGFFMWNMFDGVDGNVARYRKQFSPNGSTFDAAGGYLAMYFTFLAYGVAAYNNPGYINNWINIPTWLYIVIGSISGFALIFPRLVMHKKLSSMKEQNNNESNEVKDQIQNKANYGPLKILALNLTSISGFVQLFMLIICILAFFNIYLFDIFTICYCLINCVLMLGSLIKILK